MFLNSTEARQYAQALAQRLTAGSLAESIERGYQIAFGRGPTPSESKLAESFIEMQAHRYEQDKNANPRSVAMVDFCQSLMSANEFIYVE